MPTSSLSAPNAQQQISVLHEIGQILGATTDLEEALNLILKQICERLNMSLATVSLLHQETEQVTIDIAYGL